MRAASDSDDDDEPLCAAPGGDNNAVALEFLKPGTTGAVFVVFNCAVFVLLCSCVALCFTDLPWYHTAMVSMIDPSERTQTTDGCFPFLPQVTFLTLGMFGAVQWFKMCFAEATGRSLSDPLGDKKKAR